jgi:hypothetical protein
MREVKAKGDVEPEGIADGLGLVDGGLRERALRGAGPSSDGRKSRRGPRLSFGAMAQSARRRVVRSLGLGIDVCENTSLGVAPRVDSGGKHGGVGENVFLL